MAINLPLRNHQIHLPPMVMPQFRYFLHRCVPWCARVLPSCFLQSAPSRRFLCTLFTFIVTATE